MPTKYTREITTYVAKREEGADPVFVDVEWDTLHQCPYKTQRHEFYRVTASTL